MEVSGVLFDMCFERHEVVVDERCRLVVAVRLSFQPSASASGRGRAEVDQQWFLLRFGFNECCISVFQPMYFHIGSSYFRQDTADFTRNLVLFVPLCGY